MLSYLAPCSGRSQSVKLCSEAVQELTGSPYRVRSIYALWWLPQKQLIECWAWVMRKSTNEAPMLSCCFYKVFGNESVFLIWLNAVMCMKELQRTISFNCACFSEREQRELIAPTKAFMWLRAPFAVSNMLGRR